MRKRSLLSLGPHGFHRVAYTEWGEPNPGEAVVCLHGLTRNARDFDHLAAALVGRWRVACPDAPGRGESEWLAVKEDYNYATYCADMAALMARLESERVDWVGTSMGGLVGMMLAAQPATPVRRLVMNDIGPFVPKAALERIMGYVGSDPRFEDLAAAEAYLRQVHAPFGPLRDEHWAHLTHHSVRERREGGYGLAYDPGIAVPLKASPPEDVDLWSLWDRVRCPVLVLRGADSDVLPAEVAREMTRRGPGAELVEFDGVGHAPMLTEGDQIETLRGWLGGG